uniref:AAA_5 domain-containing protein n=1 Tax=Heterorhabditis bacteriophora TaxID=37862 RepID=A0A1I7XN60_HETBA
MCMAFLTNLDMENKNEMRMKIHIAFRVATNITIPPPHGDGQNNYVQVEGYWIERGAELPQEDNKYVITKTVKENMAEIARIICSGRFPVLLEGETSAGKTSIVCHLARLTGNSVVRINNHEHTDVQEYMGSYLFVPELNQTIPANPRFRLFATQNPAGTYSGRKRLSRALLSRFIVLKFHHLPLDELSAMVCTRCCVHMSAASKMISVLSELRLMRSLSGLFSARDGNFLYLYQFILNVAHCRLLVL